MLLMAKLSVSCTAQYGGFTAGCGHEADSRYPHTTAVMAETRMTRMWMRMRMTMTRTRTGDVQHTGHVRTTYLELSVRGILSFNLAIIGQLSSKQIISAWLSIRKSSVLWLLRGFSKNFNLIFKPNSPDYLLFFGLPGKVYRKIHLCR